MYAKEKEDIKRSLERGRDRRLSKLMFYRKQTSKKKAQKAVVETEGKPEVINDCLGQMLSESKQKSCVYRYAQATERKVKRTRTRGGCLGTLGRRKT